MRPHPPTEAIHDADQAALDRSRIRHCSDAFPGSHEKGMNEPRLADLAKIMRSYADLSTVILSPGSVLGEDLPIDSQDKLQVAS
jgi:hypothetical protein